MPTPPDKLTNQHGAEPQRELSESDREMVAHLDALLSELNELFTAAVQHNVSLGLQFDESPPLFDERFNTVRDFVTMFVTTEKWKRQHLQVQEFSTETEAASFYLQLLQRMIANLQQDRSLTDRQLILDLAPYALSSILVPLISPDILGDRDFVNQMVVANPAIYSSLPPNLIADSQLFIDILSTTGNKVIYHLLQVLNTGQVQLSENELLTVLEEIAQNIPGVLSSINPDLLVHSPLVMQQTIESIYQSFSGLLYNTDQLAVFARLVIAAEENGITVGLASTSIPENKVIRYLFDLKKFNEQELMVLLRFFNLSFDNVEDVQGFIRFLSIHETYTQAIQRFDAIYAAQISANPVDPYASFKRLFTMIGFKENFPLSYEAALEKERENSELERAERDQKKLQLARSLFV